MTTRPDESSSDEEETTQLTKKQQQELERKKLKNKKKNLSKKKKEPTQAKKETEKKSGEATDSGIESDAKKKETADDLDVDIEYVAATPEIDASDPNFGYFAQVFKEFQISSTPTDVIAAHPVQTRAEVRRDDGRSINEEILQEEMKKNKEDEKLSKRKLRLALQPSMAKLKESTPRADVVEWADVTSRDPFLLVSLKAYRNTVPVPRHWNAKRKYLAGKRGFERPAFDLPEYIKRTGIQEMRESLWEKEDHQSLKSKMRERARPKLGKIDIDYQKLHDAFFKWQTKPWMTSMGELYFEGKELEGAMRDKKPGLLSDELRIALGMPIGHNAQKFPPPWLIAMQRYGPPPSYPTLKIQGLSAPIPEGCSFGYHAGGWGKPPVDEYGKPLYGDVFGLEIHAEEDLEEESRIDRRYWGELGQESDTDSEEEEEDEEEAEAADQEGIQTPMTEGFVTPSGISSAVPTGVETPDTIELRKGKRVDESSTGAETPAVGVAYHVIPEKRVDRVGGQMMGSTHVYDLAKKQAMNEGGVEVTLNPEDIDLGDQRGLELKYEEQLRKQQRAKADDEEDFSDMVAEHTAKQNRKRKAQEQKKAASTSKKYKDFKF